MFWLKLIISILIIIVLVFFWSAFHLSSKIDDYDKKSYELKNIGDENGDN